MNNLQRLHAFRQALYQRLGPARDALFELADAVLTTPKVPSFAHLSLSPLFRRRWPSLYEALDDGRPDSQALMPLILEHLPASAFDAPILIGDHTPWPRLSARTLRDRTYVYSSDRRTKITEALPITVGYSFSTLALLPDVETNWTIPLLHERIASREAALSKAAGQLKQGTLALKRQGARRPLSLWDSQYGCAPFLKMTSEVEADLLYRLRSNRVLYGAPPPYRGRGRPPIHGHKFKLNDLSTWLAPDETVEVQSEKRGAVLIQAWHGWHFQEAPERAMTVVCVDLLDRPKAKPMFLGYIGEGRLPLKRLWHLYGRRFSIEHWYRFSKQRLHWMLPRFSTPERHERWSALMPVMSMQLYLARTVMADSRLPWQKAQSVRERTPGRVAQSMAGLIAALGTPAREPKRRGKSPGWQSGRERSRRGRQAVKKKRRKCRLKRRARAA